MLTLKQLTDVCKALNEQKVGYVLVGGWAVYIHGYERVTKDIDILIDPGKENVLKIKNALAKLMPLAAKELEPEDVLNSTVVRMVDEDVVLDLMAKIGDLDHSKAKSMVEIEKINGIDIPFANLDLMLELKGGLRDVDKKDYIFLRGKKEYLRGTKG